MSDTTERLNNNKKIFGGNGESGGQGDLEFSFEHVDLWYTGDLQKGVASDNFYVGVESSSEGCATDRDLEDMDRGGN